VKADRPRLQKEVRKRKNLQAAVPEGNSSKRRAQGAEHRAQRKGFKPGTLSSSFLIILTGPILFPAK
jgi:hypothetical protein